MRKTLRLLTIALSIAAALALPASAFADHEDDGEVVIIFPGLLTTSAVTAGAIIIAVSPPGLSTSSTTSSSSSSGDHSDSGCHAEAYIRQNNNSLRQGLALGGGEAVDDLAQLFAIPQEHKKTFARQLRKHRKDLLPLIELNKLSPKRAQAFVDHIGSAIMEDKAMARAWLPRVKKDAT